MATLTRGRETAEASGKLEVSDVVEGAGRPAKLKVGKHRFSLVVVDGNGNRSPATEIAIAVISLEPALRAVRANNEPLANNTVQAGEPFTLDGTGSKIDGGDIKSFLFTYVGPA